MRREFQEETGVYNEFWIYSGIMISKDWEVHVFHSFIHNIDEVKTTTEEVVQIISLEDLGNYDLLDNVEVLIRLCLLEDVNSFQLVY